MKKKVHKRAPRQKKFTDVTFTSDQRAVILMKMTQQQREAYAESIQLTFSDQVMNMVFDEAPSWRFIGIRVDYGWEYRKSDPRRSANLRCVCGRQLRYQYQLVSTDGHNRRVNLGSSHFMQHLGIPVSVSREVFANFNQVQRKMDEMLARYRIGERFPSANGMRKIAMSGEFGNSKSIVARRLHGFAVADLPLTKSDKNALKRFVSEFQGQVPRSASSGPRGEQKPPVKVASPSKEYLHSNYSFDEAVAMTLAELHGVPYQGFHQENPVYSQEGKNRNIGEYNPDAKDLPRPRAELEEENVVSPVSSEPLRAEEPKPLPRHKKRQGIDDLYQEKLAKLTPEDRKKMEERQRERLRAAAKRATAYKKKHAHGQRDSATNQSKSSDLEQLKRQLLQQKKREDEQKAEMLRERTASKKQRDLLHAQFIQKQAADHAKRKQLYEKYHSVESTTQPKAVPSSPRRELVGKSPFNTQLQDQLKKWQKFD
ncbi:hypothetical protein [Lacticaseibacillus hegangensis]|uniref:Uncharacterized protein n=1 Tax=Lacticaseibacillus hegangensis TaxID=2486010 RepID=A0ABW4CYL9_9LACO|nr:hypothetical protein [Lacticaseibacillus hegangensis]